MHTRKSYVLIPLLGILGIFVQHSKDYLSTDVLTICFCILLSAYSVILALAKKDTEDTEDTEK